MLLKGDPRPLPETEEKREKESEGGGYEVAVIPRNTALRMHTAAHMELRVLRKENAVGRPQLTGRP